MNQEDDFRATWLDGLARLRQGDSIATVQEQHRIVSSELLGDCKTDSAARACDEITLHLCLQKTSNVQRPTSNWKLRAPQGKPIIRRLPQTQSDEPLVETTIDCWPKRADDIFACRRRISKIFGFEIQMPISPWLNRFFDRFSKYNEVVESSAACVVFASDRRFRQVPMTVPEWIVALPIELGVLRVRKRGCMQSVRGVKRHLQSQKNHIAFPCFRKKIVALVQADTLQRHHSADAFVDVCRQALRRNGTIL